MVISMGGYMAALFCVAKSVSNGSSAIQWYVKRDAFEDIRAMEAEAEAAQMIT